MNFNVYDDGSIQSYLAGFSDDPATRALLTLCLAKALRKGPEGLKPLRVLPEGAPAWLKSKFDEAVIVHVFEPSPDLDSRVRHVADWIAASALNGEAWLQDTDGQGRPKKLLKIGSLTQAETEADKAMRRFAFQAAAMHHADGEGEESVMTFPDGSRIVRLLTSAALDHESAMMGHCVGQGAYDAGVRDRTRIVYSLRDRKGKAHVTFEVKVDGNELLQCKGKQNAPPVAAYMPQVRSFIESRGFTLKESARMTGLVQDVGGYVHSILALPPGLTVGGSLFLRGTAITRLPEGLRVHGNLDLRGTNITALPEGLSIGGGLDVRGTKITALPKRLSVGGSLYLTGLNITALPEDLSVGGCLDASVTNITALPSSLSVGGDLYLRDTKIIALPKNLSVHGNLDLRGTNIMALPEGLCVSGNLYLFGSKITALPKGLSVHGIVDLPETNIWTRIGFIRNSTLRVARSAIFWNRRVGLRPS